MRAEASLIVGEQFATAPPALSSFTDQGGPGWVKKGRVIGDFSNLCVER